MFTFLNGFICCDNDRSSSCLFAFRSFKSFWRCFDRHQGFVKFVETAAVLSTLMSIKYLEPLLEENHVGVCPCQKTSFWSNWLITGEQNVAHLSLFIFNTSNEARNREQRRLKVKDIHMAGGWIGAEVSSLPHIASVVRSIIDTPAFSAQWL